MGIPPQSWRGCHVRLYLLAPDSFPPARADDAVYILDSMPCLIIIWNAGHMTFVLIYKLTSKKKAGETL